MILVNAIALTSTVFAFLALAGEFARRVGPRLLGTCLWIFGLNGWFYLSYPIRLARAVFGDSHGLETLRRMFPWTPAGHATAMSLLSVEGNQFMFLDKFMIGTALSLTLGLAATLLLLLVRARRGEWSASHDVAFVLCIAGAILLHSVTGLTMAIATAAVLAILLVIRAQPSPGGPSYARLVGWIALGAGRDGAVPLFGDAARRRLVARFRAAAIASDRVVLRCTARVGARDRFVEHAARAKHRARVEHSWSALVAGSR